MSRSPQLAQAEVFAAIEQLLTQGLDPTSERIQQLLRNRGSPVVLRGFIADWYQQYGPAFQMTAASHRALGSEEPGERLSELLDGLLAQCEVEWSARIAALDQRFAALDSREQELRIALEEVHKALLAAQARERDAIDTATYFDA